MPAGKWFRPLSVDLEGSASVRPEAAKHGYAIWLRPCGRRLAASALAKRFASCSSN